ncbi:MAG: hypothetical protein JNK49_16640 [Planctomycetes bacterium]|nr:hypothetical protein [Planctomycetota bacterium]
MSRWLWWFLLAPYAGHLLAWCMRWGAPRLDVGVLVGLFAALFAERRALPGLVLGGALARALVGGGRLPLHVLALGAAIALLLPLCGRWPGRQLWWQVLAAAWFAALLPWLDGLLAAWFQAPRELAPLGWADVLWAAGTAPVLVLVLHRLPPCRPFVEAG